MSLALCIAIHKALVLGLTPEDGSLAPYAGMWVPHNDIVELPDEWELSSDDEYDCFTGGPDELSRKRPLIFTYSDGFGWIYTTDYECMTCFRIQRKEQ